jgi:hypothetical protein
LILIPEESSPQSGPTTDDGDASLVSPLLDQVSGPIASVTAGDAYDSEPVYRIIGERDSAAAVIIPPRSTAVLSGNVETASTQQDWHLQITHQSRSNAYFSSVALAPSCSAREQTLKLSFMFH